MSSTLVAAFVAGLLGSVHCVGMCGAFAGSCARARGGLLAWHLGRVGTYALLGALAGSVGRLLPGPGWLPAALASVLLLWFALALAGFVPEPRLLPPGLLTAAGRVAATPSVPAQLAFGVVNGFLPCGMVYSALSIPVALASPIEGALAMAAFGLGTLPALSLAALGIRRIMLATRGRRRAFAALILVVGSWSIWQRTSPPVAAMNHHDHHQSRESAQPSFPKRAQE